MSDKRFNPIPSKTLCGASVTSHDLKRAGNDVFIGQRSFQQNTSIISNKQVNTMQANTRQANTNDSQLAIQTAPAAVCMLPAAIAVRELAAEVTTNEINLPKIGMLLDLQLIEQHRTDSLGTDLDVQLPCLDLGIELPGIPEPGGGS